MSLLTTTKEYMRIEGTDSDTELTTLILAAKTYLQNAGVDLNEASPLYCLAVGMLVLHWYDNRGAMLVGTISKKMEFSLDAIIQQLKYCNTEE